MASFWILSPFVNSIGKNIGYALDVPGVDDIQQITDRLANAGIVHGHRLEVDDDGSRTGVKMVRRRIPTAITIRGISQVTPLTWRLIEE